MEGNLQTSFIPKKPIAQGISRPRTGVNFLTLFAVIVFLISIALAGAVLIYKTYLNKNIASMKDSFEANKKAFVPEEVETYVTLNKRINVANTLLKSHVAISNLFNLLQQATLRSVRFTSFTYTYVNDKRITLAMKGQAQGHNYNPVAKQSDVFSENPVSKYIHNPIFADLDLDANNNVTFSFNADIDPQQLLYRNNPLPGSQVDTTATPSPEAPLETSTTTQP